MKLWIIEHDMSPDAGAGIIGVYESLDLAKAAVARNVPEAELTYEDYYQSEYRCGPGETITISAYVMNTWI